MSCHFSFNICVLISFFRKHWESSCLYPTSEVFPRSMWRIMWLLEFEFQSLFIQVLFAAQSFPVSWYKFLYCSNVILFTFYTFPVTLFCVHDFWYKHFSSPQYFPQLLYFSFSDYRNFPLSFLYLKYIISRCLVLLYLDLPVALCYQI